jgi:hypothetical protein
MKQDEQCCGNCRCWRQDEDEEVLGVGRCCRHAPRPQLMSRDTLDDPEPGYVWWPPTAETQWCREWEPFPLAQGG